MADEREPRFRINRCSVSQGGTWGWTRYVVPIDSDTARAEIAGARWRIRIGKADDAYDAWRRECSAENLSALIDALHTVESLATSSAEVK